jgi:ubiquinone biosynthesis protein
VALLGNLVLVLAFAWVVRGLLGARSVTWPRLIIAVVLGSAIGALPAGLLVLDLADLADPTQLELDRGELATLAAPFQVVATMLLVVVMELVAARPPRPSRGPRLVRPLRAVRRSVGVTARAVAVTRIVTRQGLAPALGLRRGEISARDPAELARRARRALEDAGGMFIKLGQLLATRPDLLPRAAIDELGRLHSGARPLPVETVAVALRDELGRLPDELFAWFDPRPLGSASIAQAHRARLHDGREVVVKVQRPGLDAVVERDLTIVRWLARTAQRRTPWGRAYGAQGLAEEFATALRGELDFDAEARNAIELADAVADQPQVHVPEIVEELTTSRVLVMELLDGPTLTNLAAPLAADAARAVADALCASQVTAMLQGRRFHGDPHPGNLLVLADGRVGLIDFGITGKLDAVERASMLQLLVAIKLESPALLYESLVAVGALHPATPPDVVERRLARFLAAHLGPGLPPAEALTELLRMLGELDIRLPAQSSVMFRALATLAGTLEGLVPGYPLIERVADVGGEELRSHMAPDSLNELVQQHWAELGPLVRRVPRHLDRIATLVEHGGLTTRLRLFGDPADVRVLSRLLNRAVLTVMSLGVGLVAVLMIGTPAGPVLAGTEVRLLEMLGWIALFAATVLLLRVLLDALRSDVRDPGSPPW